VVRQIQKAGLKKIRCLADGKDKTLLIRAHGASVHTFQKAHALKYHIVDATCPMVKEIHKIVKTCVRKGRRIIVIGDKEHDEVRGITGQLKTKSIVIDRDENIPWKRISRIKKACVVVQSTQNLEKAIGIVEKLKADIKDLLFFNTICRPTRIKQEEIKNMPLVHDVMIIIGSRNSANTRRLYEISKSLNKKTYWIQSKNEIRKAWFKGAKTVGITSGSSTPDSTTEEVVCFIKRSPLTVPG
jgi:4-hydroxy-3-methylbut-2-enyl diphosphate reductase